jgi:nucleotide-binding universal stress UspA family protein
MVPVDRTPGSDRVLGRLALLPLADKARVMLLHVVPENLPSPDRRNAERDARKSLGDETRHLRKLLPGSVVIEPAVKRGAAAEEIAACAKAMNAELIIMGRGRGRPLRDVFLGSTAERVTRQSRLPVLVVRLPSRTVYSRPALALDLDQAAQEILRVMFRVIPPPRPRVQIIHAVDDPYRGMMYSNPSQDEEAERTAELELEASAALAKLLATTLVQNDAPIEHALYWKSHVRLGSPRLVIEKAVKKAESDLLVLGTRGYSGIAQMSLGTVAGDVLRNVACDVLVVPPRPPRK